MAARWRHTPHIAPRTATRTVENRCHVTQLAEYGPNHATCGVPKPHPYLEGLTSRPSSAKAKAASSHGWWRRLLHSRVARVPD